jgi:hypothetical protein
MINVISEADLAIICDNAACTRQACYVIVLQASSVLIRMYCPECTRRLTEGVAKILLHNDIKVHDVLEVDHLLTDGGICALAVDSSND